jgi:hypothetical protein
MSAPPVGTILQIQNSLVFASQDTAGTPAVPMGHLVNTGGLWLPAAADAQSRLLASSARVGLDGKVWRTVWTDPAGLASAYSLAGSATGAAVAQETTEPPGRTTGFLRVNLPPGTSSAASETILRRALQLRAPETSVYFVGRFAYSNAFQPVTLDCNVDVTRATGAVWEGSFRTTFAADGKTSGVVGYGVTYAYESSDGGYTAIPPVGTAGGERGGLPRQWITLGIIVNVATQTLTQGIYTDGTGTVQTAAINQPLVSLGSSTTPGVTAGIVMTNGDTANAHTLRTGGWWIGAR